MNLGMYACGCDDLVQGLNEANFTDQCTPDNTFISPEGLAFDREGRLWAFSIRVKNLRPHIFHMGVMLCHAHPSLPFHAVMVAWWVPNGLGIQSL